MKKLLLLGVIASLCVMGAESYATPVQSGAKEMPPVGPWKIVAFFEGGAFQGCIAGIGGDGGGANQYLRVEVSPDKKYWGFTVPGPEYEPIPEGTKADVSTNLKNSRGNSYHFTTTMNNGDASTQMNKDMINDFFNLGRNAGPDEIGFNAWINNRQTSMGWTLSSRQKAFKALHSCIDQNGSHRGLQKQKTAAKNPYTMVQRAPVGLWQTGAIYKNGKFEACAASLPGRMGNLTIFQKANKSWHLELPSLAGFAPGSSSAPVKERLGNMQERPVVVNIDPDDRSLSRTVSHAWVADFFAMAENEDYYTNGIVRDTYQVRMGRNFATTMKWNLSSQQDVLMTIEACMQKNNPVTRAAPRFQPKPSIQATPRFQRKPAPRFQPRATSRYQSQASARYGAYTAISINRNIVKGVIAEGNNVYVKIPSQGNITVKISNGFKSSYRKWGQSRWVDRSGFVKTVRISNSDRGTGKKGYTWRVNTGAKFIEYYVNGRLVLHLKHD